MPLEVGATSHRSFRLHCQQQQQQPPTPNLHNCSSSRPNATTHRRVAALQQLNNIIMDTPPDDTLDDDEPERKACIEINPVGFHLRPPPPPHRLDDFLTPDASLFQTIHMGTAIVDPTKWQLRIDGLVAQPLTLDLAALQRFPTVTLTAFHECYGSPLAPPIHALHRIGNARWTGARLHDLLAAAQPLPPAQFVWSDGLDAGSFAGVPADRYRKDLPLAKARAPEVLVAWALHGAPLSPRRGGPVRLVVPGWFGTNSTKWLCRLQLRPARAMGPFTTRFYNLRVPAPWLGAGACELRPVWGVEPNSVVVRPEAGAVVRSGEAVEVWGWAWGEEGVVAVRVGVDGGRRWVAARVDERVEFEWQRFEASVSLPPGIHSLLACATSASGVSQPLTGHRNHVHTVHVIVR